MEPHPIEELMKTVMESIKEMIDVNTIVGDAVQTVDGTVIIPVSRVTFGFAAGGGEYAKKDDTKNQDSKFPFAGGSGAGVSINPVAFMIVGRNNTIKLIPASPQTSIDRLLDTVPGIIEQMKKALTGKDPKDSQNGKDQKAHGSKDKECDREKDNEKQET
jgi:sporulation protein YtfJ